MDISLIWKKSIVAQETSIIHNGKMLEDFILKSETREDFSFSALLFNIVLKAEVKLDKRKKLEVWKLYKGK